MTDEEIAVALKGHDHEIGSLKHRMKDVEGKQVAIHDLVISVKELALNMQHMIEEQKEQGRRLEALEKEPIDPAIPPSISKAGSELSLTDGAGRLRLYCYDGVPGIGIVQNGKSIYWDFETIRQLLER